jgi:hypothetical protein
LAAGGANAHLFYRPNRWAKSNRSAMPQDYFLKLEKIESVNIITASQFEQLLSIEALGG